MAALAEGAGDEEQADATMLSFLWGDEGEAEEDNDNEGPGGKKGKGHGKGPKGPKGDGDEPKGPLDSVAGFADEMG